MKRIATASALALIFVTPAFAADLPSRAAPPVYVPPPLPVFSWTGFYAGIQGGYAFGKDSTNVIATVPGRVLTIGGGSGGGGGGGGTFAEAAAPVVARGVRTGSAGISSKLDGIVGGGHVGYNFSTATLLGGFLGPAGVFGIEGDAEGLDNNNTQFASVGGQSASQRIRSELQGSIRGRLGIGFDRFLVYGTGGAAFGDFKSTYSLNASPVQSFDITRVGYTVGGGIEYAFTNNWSIRAEYRYSDYGTFTNTFAVGPAAVVVRQHETNQRIEGGLSYLFTTPVVPVVARY